MSFLDQWHGPVEWRCFGLNGTVPQRILVLGNRELSLGVEL